MELLLANLLSDAAVTAVETAGITGADGCVRARVPIESPAHALADFLRLGATSRSWSLPSYARGSQDDPGHGSDLRLNSSLRRPSGEIAFVVMTGEPELGPPGPGTIGN